MEGPRQQVGKIQSHSASLPVEEHSGEEKRLRDAKISGMRTEREVAGHRLTVISSVNTAGLVLRQGGDLFVIKVTGLDPFNY